LSNGEQQDRLGRIEAQRGALFWRHVAKLDHMDGECLPPETRQDAAPLKGTPARVLFSPDRLVHLCMVDQASLSGPTSTFCATQPAR
jgi:hypothetical protein